jgi:ribosomal protein S27E
MGGAFDYRIYEQDDRQKIRNHFESACDSARIEDGCSYPGTIAAMSGIASWHDKAFATQQEAEEWLSNNHNKWDDAKAVSYMLPVAPTDRDRKRVEKASIKVTAACAKRDALITQARDGFRNGKSKLVGCKGCDSRMNREKLVASHSYRALQCPLCGYDLVSPTLRERINKAQAKLDLASQARNEASKPRASKKKGWIVGGWCSS